MEAEMAFADIDDLIDMVEACFKYIVQFAVQQCPQDFQFLERNAPILEILTKFQFQDEIKLNFPRIRYKEAIQILQDSEQRFDFPVTDYIAREHQRYLGNRVFSS
eukprot:TRINITY_DN3861_c0_g1_i3.p3 TRINITY_DN3861_c0_g1~~TRINITY_DN3861_c0_g1_i3.p3  ORF type:complete len:105 (-),score=33.13 TRINITY_DN3861_c0_g1_i3:417-731(-)